MIFFFLWNKQTSTNVKSTFLYVKLDNLKQNNRLQETKTHFLHMYNHKLFFLILFFSISILNCYGQKSRIKLLEKFKNIQSYLPSDKLFLQTDKNLYCPGDTIYFQTYIENRFTQSFETSSLSSWVLLLNQEGETIDSARFRIDYSMAPGWLAIPKESVPGWYRLKAFTSQMQNFSPEFAFSSWIRIDELLKENLVFNSRFNRKHYHSKDTVELSIELKNQDGEPVKNTSFSYSIIENNKTKSTYRAKTTRKGISLIRIFLPDSLANKNVNLNIALEKGLGEFRVEIPVIEQNPDIRFLPEGGTFIPGYKQRIAFNGVKPSGEQLFLKGTVSDNTGNFIDSIESDILGPGIIEFTPEAGREYYAEFTDYPGQKWPLPKFAGLVPCIRVTRSSKGFAVDISGGDKNEQYFLALSKNHNPVAFVPFTINSRKRIVFNTDSLPPGMAKVILFNQRLRPLAERAFFIPQKEASRLNISTVGNYTQPNQHVTLGIEIKNGDKKNNSGVFSIAVVDSATALSRQISLLGIKDCFFFDNTFYKELPLHIKQKGILNLPAEELDLLFLTYSWSKFNSEIPGKQEKEKPVNYEQYKIEITQTHSSRKRKKINSNKEPLLALSIDEPAILGLYRKKDNSYLLSIDSIPSFTNKIMIVPNFALKNKINAASLNPIINKYYFESLKNQKENKAIFNQAPQDISKELVFNLDSFRVIKEIGVYAKREPAKKFANEYEKRYQGVSTRTLTGVRIESAMTLEDILRRLNPRTLNLSRKTIHFRPTTSFTAESPPALFVLDGTPIETNYSSLMSINPSHIHSVTVLLGVSGFFIYGEDAKGGVVFIETKLNHIGDEYELPAKAGIYRGDLRKVIELFRGSKEFYNPPKIAIQNNPELWIRPTLYWNPEVFYDGKNPVKIQYYNHRKKGAIFIVVNGVTEKGEPVAGIHKYKIK